MTIDEAHLTISSVSAADQGEYECSAMDPDINLEMTRTYNVQVEAYISYTLVAGDRRSASLQCYLHTGLEKAKANAVWFKETEDGQKTTVLTKDNGTRSEDEKAELLYPLDYDQTMMIRDVTMEDQGLYQCESPEGIKLSTIRLIVKYLPTAPSHSCEGSTGAWEECETGQSRANAAVLTEALTDFSFLLFSSLSSSHPERNLLFSPISISGTLAHLLLGARNKTREDIESALRLPFFLSSCVHSEMKRLREQLSDSLEMASQIYYNTKSNLSESFLVQSEEFYGSVPVKLQENSEANVHMINSWVADKTNNKITQLVKSVSEQTQLMLLNAVSFSGLWTIKFSEKPGKGYFTKLNGDMVKVPTLQNDKFVGSVAYVAELKAQVMRFGLTGNNSLYILLPQTHKASDLRQMEERLTDTAVRRMVDHVRTTTPQRVEVTLPQIKLNVEEDISALLRRLGLHTLFDGAPLCGLYAEEPLAVEEAKHKAYLALTETGVEAAAVTALGFSRSFLTFSALRPFNLVLWSDIAQVPLFIGRVTEP